MKKFLAVRGRLRELDDALRTANQKLAETRLADAERLKQHVIAGGRAAEYVSEIPAAERGVLAAKQDISIVKDMAGELHCELVYALRDVMDEGQATANEAIAPVAAEYNQLVTECELARRRYLDTVGEVMFWRYLRDRYSLNARLTQMDSVNTRRGPMTKVDHGTFVLMHDDALTHERLNARDDLW